MVKKIGKVISSVLVSILVVILIFCTLSAYIKWEPPMSVLLVLFRMMLQITLKYLIIGLFLIEFAYYVFCLIHKKRSTYGLVLSVICMVCLILNLVSFARIKMTAAKQSGISYEATTAGTGKDSFTLAESHNYAEQFKVKQCKVYVDEKSPYKGTCIIYLNYGGWSVQEETFGAQVKNFCEKEGYSFVRLAAERLETENILTLAQKTDDAINQLLAAEKYEHVYLIGGSAGGHMALLCAYKESSDPKFSVSGIQGIDGVIALYPCADPGYSYDYFVNNASTKQGILGKMGDFLYCSLYNGDTGTFAGETRKLDESVFGVRGNEDSYYETTAIKNCLGDKNIPVLIVQGDSDSMVSVPASRELANKLAENGKTVAYLELPGVEHVFDMMPTAAWDRCESEMTGFIREKTN